MGLLGQYYKELIVMPTLQEHIDDTGNPHNTTKQQIGLGNVQNYAPSSLSESLIQSVTDKYITPNTLQYAITNRLSVADNNNNGVIATNSGLISGDDSNTNKALTASGISTIVSVQNTSPNLIQNSILSLIKRSDVVISSIIGDNNIVATTTIPITTANLYGIINFTAIANNTSAVTFRTTGLAKPVVGWDNLPLVAGNILTGNSYSLIPLNDKFILTNPSDVNVSSLVNSLLSNHILDSNPHPQYASIEQAKLISSTSFRGAHLGGAILSGSNYTASLPGAIITSGLFTATFSAQNTSNNTLTIDNVTKPLLTISGSVLPPAFILAGETRIILHVAAGFKIYPLNEELSINDLVSIFNSNL